MPQVWQRYAPYGFLAVAIFVVYSNIFDNVFLFDDDLLIRLNSYLRDWSTFGHLLTGSTTEGAHIAGGFYRPIQNLLYFIIFQIGGEQVFGYHLLNVGLHIGNACFGYQLATRLGLDPRAALLAMLIWAVHPLQTEAITYMSGTADPLFVFFMLWGLNVVFPEAQHTKQGDAVPLPPLREGLGVGVQLASPRVSNSASSHKTSTSDPPLTPPASGRGTLAAPSVQGFQVRYRIWLSVPIFALALLSKETAVVFPALVCVCLYFTSEQRFNIKTYFSTWPLWLIAFVYLAWRVTSPDFDGPERYAHLYNLPEYATLRHYAEDPFLRVMTFLATLPAYAQLLLWPVGLHMERAFPLYNDPTSPYVIGGFVMLGAALTQILWVRRGSGFPLSWGLLWFGAAHVPNSGLLFSMNSLFLEHWMYLPTLGLFLGFSQTAFTFFQRIKMPMLTNTVLGLSLVAITVLSARTYDQNKIWREPIVFYNHIFAYGVVSPRAHNNLAIAYMNEHQLPQAIEEYRRAVKEGDTYAETHYNLALALLALPDQRAQLPQAITELERSLQIEPGFYRSYAALAQIYAQTGDSAKAEAYQRKAQELLGR